MNLVGKLCKVFVCAAPIVADNSHQPLSCLYQSLENCTGTRSTCFFFVLQLLLYTVALFQYLSCNQVILAAGIGGFCIKTPFTQHLCKLITNLITELITNNAAAALAFPLALSIATQLGVDPMPFFMVICIASSAGFTTPIGYQTNLIVQGIGNYKFTDFVRIGLPLNIIVFLISIFLIPQIWPFEF